MLAELDLCNPVTEHLADPVQSCTKRAPRIKGAAPTRKSDRSSILAHSKLSEKVLSGETLSERLCYKLSRKAFESESMPSKWRLQHEFDEAFVFSNDATYDAAADWFTILNL